MWQNSDNFHDLAPRANDLVQGMTTTKIKKRFVAGAKCPKCGAKDSILLFKENGIETVECTECDYREQQTDEKVAEKATGAVIGVFKPD